MRGQPTVLSYKIVDAEVEQQGYLRSAPGARPTLTFSDGTVLKLAEHARMRLTRVHAHGARLTLEDGQVRAEVVHKPEADWDFEAGPFLVEVKGTVFSLAWSGQAGKLDVALETGRLNIRTPFAEQPVALGSGQRLIVTLADKHVDIIPLDAAPGAGAAASSPSLGACGGGGSGSGRQLQTYRCAPQHASQLGREFVEWQPQGHR